MNESVEQPSGNYYDKYKSKNVIERHLMSRFLQSFDRLVGMAGVGDAHEAGCGEGILTMRLAERGIKVRGFDISPEVVETAKMNAGAKGLTIPFRTGNIYDLQPSEDAASLMVCCEVMEHLPDSSKALAVLASLARPYLLVSVPREPIWRILNLMRGAYLSELGNTPGHIQHWSTGAFVNLLKQRFDIERVEQPLPWTMVLCRVRDK